MIISRRVAFLAAAGIAVVAACIAAALLVFADDCWTQTCKQQQEEQREEQAAADGLERLRQAERLATIRWTDLERQFSQLGDLARRMQDFARVTGDAIEGREAPKIEAEVARLGRNSYLYGLSGTGVLAGLNHEERIRMMRVRVLEQKRDALIAMLPLEESLVRLARSNALRLPENADDMSRYLSLHQQLRRGLVETPARMRRSGVFAADAVEDYEGTISRSLEAARHAERAYIAAALQAERRAKALGRPVRFARGSQARPESKPKETSKMSGEADSSRSSTREVEVEPEVPPAPAVSNGQYNPFDMIDPIPIKR